MWSLDALDSMTESKMPDLRELVREGLLDKIDEWCLEQAKKEPRREYLGASGWGNKCLRQMWYDFRWCSPRQYDPRHWRRQESGRLWELRVIEILKAVGIEFIEPPEGHDQFEFFFHNGLIGGHLDGACLNIPEAPKSPHLFENKALVSALYDWNDDWTWARRQRRELKNNRHGKWFDIYKRGVARAVPAYFDQLQGYMAASHKFYKEWGLPKPLKRALFFFVSTDLDQFAYERIPYNRQRAVSLYNRAMSVVRAEEPPERYSEDPNNWECVFCEHRETCHAGAEYVASCRSCKHAKITEDDIWICGLLDLLPKDREWEPCGDWEPNI